MITRKQLIAAEQIVPHDSYYEAEWSLFYAPRFAGRPCLKIDARGEFWADYDIQEYLNNTNPIAFFTPELFRQFVDDPDWQGSYSDMSS